MFNDNEFVLFSNMFKHANPTILSELTSSHSFPPLLLHPSFPLQPPSFPFILSSPPFLYSLLHPSYPLYPPSFPFILSTLPLFPSPPILSPVLPFFPFYPLHPSFIPFSTLPILFTPLPSLLSSPPFLYSLLHPSYPPPLPRTYMPSTQS